MKTLVVYIDVQDMANPEFCRLLEHIFELPVAQGHLKLNVFDQPREEISRHMDKLEEEKGQ